MKYAMWVYFVCLLVALYDLNAHASERLIGGEIADMKDWPASVLMKTSSSWCSATVVGERVVLTAAHCVAHKARVTFNGKDGTCYRHPDYAKNHTADWVLCLLDEEFEAEKYETLNTDPEMIEKGLAITNSGFGCVRWGGGSDKKFRTGVAPVIQLPSASNHDMVTRGKSAICSGDSGGAAFLVEGNSRVVMGVNSRSDRTVTSFLPSVAQKTFQIWAVKFMEEHKVYICGLGNDGGKCR